MHIGIDERSLEIRAAEFTTGDVGDAPMLPELPGQIPPEQEIASVPADGAFDTRKCHDAIAARSTAAIIPPRKTAKPWKPDTAGAIARNEILLRSQRVGRTNWRRWSGHHRRSRAEAKMHCPKLLGQRLSARDLDRQAAEVRVRIAVLNGFTALGTPITEVTGQIRPGERGRPTVIRFVQQSPPHSPSQHGPSSRFRRGKGASTRGRSEGHPGKFNAAPSGIAGAGRTAFLRQPQSQRQSPKRTFRVTVSTGRSRAMRPATHSQEPALRTAPLPRRYSARQPLPRLARPSVSGVTLP
jgi:hypothetical protein